MYKIVVWLIDWLIDWDYDNMFTPFTGIRQAIPEISGH